MKTIKDAIDVYFLEDSIYLTSCPDCNTYGTIKINMGTNIESKCHICKRVNQRGFRKHDFTTDWILEKNPTIKISVGSFGENWLVYHSSKNRIRAFNGLTEAVNFVLELQEQIETENK